MASLLVLLLGQPLLVASVRHLGELEVGQPGYYDQRQGYHGQDQGYHGQPGYHGQDQGYHGQDQGYHGKPGYHGQPGHHGQGGYHGQHPGNNYGPPQGNRFGQYRPPAWVSNHMQLPLGPFDGYLVPALVPQPGEHLVLMNREAANWVETNEYMWYAYEQPILRLQGSFLSHILGHQSVHVRDLNGQEVFKIRKSKHVMNPLTWRYSYRILPPHSKSNDDTLYTINKDNIGTGLMWLKEEWWIWRGREKMNQLVYYCQGSYMGWDYKFYRSKSDFENGAEPVAWIEQELNMGAFMGAHMEFLPENYRIHVSPGQDTALIMSVSTIIDMVHDQKDRESNSFIQQNQTVSVGEA